MASLVNHICAVEITCSAINNKEEAGVRGCGKGMISVEMAGKAYLGTYRPEVWIVDGVHRLRKKFGTRQERRTRLEKHAALNG
jgi:hypothetical protein